MAVGCDSTELYATERVVWQVIMCDVIVNYGDVTWIAVSLSVFCKEFLEQSHLSLCLRFLTFLIYVRLVDSVVELSVIYVV